VGASSIRAPMEVAIFLSHLCPPGCQINADNSWDSVGTETDKALKVWNHGWVKVGWLLPALIRAGATIRSLEKRVHELESDCELRG